MTIKTTWKGKMQFKSKIDSHTVTMDASHPLGDNKGASPRDLLASALASSTAMDIVGLLRKYRQVIDQFEVEVNTELTTEYPVAFKRIELIYHLDGECDEGMVLEAIHLAHTKYSGVYAMLSVAVPINWKLILNEVDSTIGASEFLSHE